MDWNEVGTYSGISFEKKFEWIMRDTYLGEKFAVAAEVMKVRKEMGKSTKGHAVQSYSHMKVAIPQGIENNDPEVLALCEKWGIDPTIPMAKQDRTKVREAWERIKAERAQQA